MMYKISLITGDGIGPEISESAISVLDTIHDKYDLKFEITKLLAGDKALEITGNPLPDETINIIKDSDACLKAPVGESAADVIVVLRRMLDLYANIRPAKSVGEDIVTTSVQAVIDGINRIMLKKMLKEKQVS